MTQQEKNELLELRKKAYAAFADHENDMAKNPNYKKLHEEIVAQGERKLGCLRSQNEI